MKRGRGEESQSLPKSPSRSQIELSLFCASNYLREKNVCVCVCLGGGGVSALKKKNQSVPSHRVAELQVPVCQVRDRRPPLNPATIEVGGSQRARGSRSRVRAPRPGQAPTRGEPDWSGPACEERSGGRAVMLTHAAALAGRARPLLCTGSGAPGRRLHPPASGELRSSSRPASAAASAPARASGGEQDPRLRTVRTGPRSPGCFRSPSAEAPAGSRTDSPHPLPRRRRRSAPRSRTR